MVLAHNLTAINAQRQFNIVGTAKRKSTEKLSSGYKINRAADDAAGLSISEKMRKQIRGLNRASDNCQDGVSLCQVADGALAETHEILQRINELSIQSANGTNSSSDRAAIQMEVVQLTDEVERIANSTSFNEKLYPLKGREISFDKIKTSPSGEKWILPNNLIEMAVLSKNDLGIGGNGYLAYKHNDIEIIPGQSMVAHGLGISDWSDYDCKWQQIQLNGARADSDGIVGNVSYDLYLEDLNVDDEGRIFYYEKGRDNRLNYLYIVTYQDWWVEAKGANPDDKWLAGNVEVPTDPTLSYEAIFTYFRAKPYNELDEYHNENDDIYGNNSNQSGVTIHAGSEGDMTLKIPVNFVNATKKGLGLTNPELNLSTEDGATAAIDRVKNAIEIVSGYRSYFGAVQNRMEHTISNLDNVVENTQAAESRIRDTDMATEMVNNTKLNVLEQAVTSMLAQANQSTQGVLSLLQ